MTKILESSTEGKSLENSTLLTTETITTVSDQQVLFFNLDIFFKIKGGLIEFNILDYFT